MSLSEGSRHGPYEVLASVGFGGIGPAYAARDTERDRDVIIQPLSGPQALAGDRLADVRRAVAALDSLVHPGLARIFEVDTSLLPPILVSEYPDGQTIAELLESDLGPRFGFEPARALAIAEQVASALDALHARGFVHGNLRSATVTLAPDGHAIVHGASCRVIPAPDAVGEAAGSSRAAPDLDAGELDRAAYLSPEQARGEPAGPASDCWALGVLLYEMLAGVRPFLGEDASDMCAAILGAPAEWSALPIDTPRPARELLKACLEQDPARRPADAAAILDALEPYRATRPAAPDGVPAEESERAVVSEVEPAIGDESGEAEPLDRSDEADSGRRFEDTGIVKASPWLDLGAAEKVSTTETVAVPIPAEVQIAEPSSDPDEESSAARAPRRLALAAAALLIGVVAGGAAVWLSRPGPPTATSTYVLSAPPSRPPAVSDATQHDLAISPDGTVVAYAVIVDGRRQLYRRPVGRLEGVVLPDLPSPQTIFFSWDGRSIGFADGESAWHAVALDGTSLRRLADRHAPARGAAWGPDDTIIVAEEGSGLIRVTPPRGTRTPLTTPDRARREVGHYWPQVLPDGRGVLFTVVSEGTERPAVAVLDPATGSIRRLIPNGQSAHYVDPGHIVYSAGGSLYGVAFDPVRLELRGYPVPLVHDVVSKSSGAASFGVSRSGSLVYVPGRLPGFQPRTLAWVDRDGAEEPLPADPRGYSRARVQPDGRRLALEVREPEPERLVWDLEGERLQPALAALSDGARAVASRPVATSGDADVPAPVGTEGASALTGSDGAAGAGTLSPDGRWIAFESDERGRPEVFVREAAESSEQASQVTTSGGRHPLWSPAGDELFYVDLDGAMMAVDIETDPSFSAGEPHELFRGPYLFDRAERPFDISPDGERFLVIRQDDSLPPLAFDIVIVEGWADHLSTLPSLR